MGDMVTRRRKRRYPLVIFFLLSVLVHFLAFRGLFISELIDTFFGKTERAPEPIVVEFLKPPPEEAENPEAKRLAAATHRSARERAPRDLGDEGTISLAHTPRDNRSGSGPRPDISRLFPDYRDLLRPGSPGTQAPVREDTVSLNTQEFRYLSYFSKLKQRIEMNWSYPMISQVRGEQGELLLRFTIAKGGTLERVALLKSSGHSLLDEAAVAAVRGASPFPPLPVRLGLDRLNVLATFEYILGYRSMR